MRWNVLVDDLDESRGRPVMRLTMILLFAMLAAHVVLAWYTRRPGVAWGEDDSAYILLARELRRFSYREVQDILAPVHARFPPLFPAALAVVGLIGGERLDTYLAWVTFCSLASIILLFDATRRTFGQRFAVIVAGLYALNPLTIRFSGILMAEAQFFALIMLALWATVREEEGTRFRIIAGAAAIGAALTRTAGVIAIVALFAHWLTRRRYRDATLFAGCAALTVGAWLGFTFLAPEAEHRRLYVADLAGPRQQERGILVTIARRIPLRLSYLLRDLLPSAVALPTRRGTWLDNAAWLGISLAVWPFGLFALSRRWKAMAWFAFFYGGLLVIWRFALERFVYPVIPALLILFVVGTAVLARRFAPRFQWPVTLTMAVLLLAGAAQQNAATIGVMNRCDRRQHDTDPHCWPKEYIEYMTAARWIRDSIPRSAIFFVSKERAFYMLARRKTINQDRALEEDSLSLGPYLRSRGVTHSVVTRVGLRFDDHARLVSYACRDFILLGKFGKETTVMRVRREDEPIDLAACRALAPWRALKPRNR